MIFPKVDFLRVSNKGDIILDRGIVHVREGFPKVYSESNAYEECSCVEEDFLVSL